ncbi:hypothetical protein [Nocardia jiangxiensis]|uniref:Activator of Hsp90 ATPase homolog 1-like protein n=1 Tax=Nocardia jiangxiensis TaxID=282685 RepID=A0ABW6SB01_9NOCA|nr:hypothetical protein [Nocardia jiangxiensis]
MSTPAVPILRGSATVALPIDRAFAFFTESFGSWWPAAYHIGQSEMADVSEGIAHTIAERGGGWSTLLELFAKTAENHSTGGDPA